jgi:hypothetical protein
MIYYIYIYNYKSPKMRFLSERASFLPYFLFAPFPKNESLRQAVLICWYLDTGSLGPNLFVCRIGGLSECEVVGRELALGNTVDLDIG